MPSTINGVGTSYFGKKNLVKRQGVCRFCQRQVQLSSYDTRLCLVVLFIPVVPLGRKRVIDQCPNCRRHMVAKADQYEMSRQLASSGAQARFREDPSPVAALQSHAELLAFHQFEPANELRRTADVSPGMESVLKLMLSLLEHQPASLAEA